jgi:tetratricopeptide (TPR) repeat protein
VTGSMPVSDLGAELERYELADELSPAEFDRYYATEVELESRLTALAGARAVRQEFADSRDLFDEVIKLNQVMRSVARKQLDRPGSSEEYRERLAGASDAASGLILLIQGQICQNKAEEQILGGNLVEGKIHLEHASECYAELHASAFPQQEIGRVTGALTVTKIEFFDGVAAMQRGKYETAKEWFEEARSKYGVLKDDLESAAGTDPRAQNTLEEFLRELNDQFAYTDIMIRFVSFFGQMQADNVGDALVYVDDSVVLYEAWGKRGAATSLPEQVQAARAMELAHFKGWQAWAHAEHALERQDWAECQLQIRAAKEHWAHSSDLARRHALLGLPAPQYQTSNGEMLLQATTRRWKSEKRLYDEIDRLKEYYRGAGALNVNAYGGHVMKHEEKSNISIGGDVEGPVAAGHARVHVGDRTTTKSGDTTTTHTETTTTVTQLRELAENLSELREALETWATTDAQRESVAQLATAEQQARIGDEKGVAAHLKKAGQWAMTMAGKLAMTAAETAIKTSLGA